MWGRHRLRITGRRVREKTPGAIRDSRQISLPSHDERWHGGENAAGYPPQSFRTGPAPSMTEAWETETDQEKHKPDGGARGRGSIPLMSERWGTRRDSEKRVRRTFVHRGKRSRRKTTSRIFGNLLGTASVADQDSLAFSNELFGGFLMHGEETGRITNHEVRDADVRNGDLLRLNHPRAVQKHQQQQDAPAPEDKKANVSQYLTLHTISSL